MFWNVIELKMTTKGVIKRKKLQTTLAKAIEPRNEKDDDEVDVSHVGRPIDTSIHNLRDVISLLQNATPEVIFIFTFQSELSF